MSAAELIEQVRGMVKAGDAVARAVWAVVREDPVVAARVRGALAGLKAEYRGHRDEAMWLLWINRVQRQLTAEPVAEKAPAAEVVLDAPAEAAFPAELGFPAEVAVPADGAFSADAAFSAETAFSAEPAFQVPEVVAPRPQVSAPALLFQEPTSSHSA